MSQIPIARYYRHEILVERLTAIQGELAAVADSVYRIEDSLESEHLDEAQRFLQLAARAMQNAQAEARLRCAPELLQAQLVASLELVNENPERLRRERQS